MSVNETGEYAIRKWVDAEIRVLEIHTACSNPDQKDVIRLELLKEIWNKFFGRRI